jgi:hypothetical protein
MIRTAHLFLAMPHLAGLVASSALSLIGCPGAQAQPEEPLSEFIRLNLFASPFAGVQIPEQWCYYTPTDLGYNSWYVRDSASGVLGAVQAQNGFGIPFSGSYGGAIGAIIVGYVVDGGPPAGNLTNASPRGANIPACAIGARILTGGPYPIVGLAANLAHQASVDPAPEYRVWTVKGSYHRVRLIQVIPISFQIANSAAAGRLVFGITGDW